jgi:hypothetical protein
VPYIKRTKNKQKTVQFTDEKKKGLTKNKSKNGQ